MIVKNLKISKIKFHHLKILTKKFCEKNVNISIMFPGQVKKNSKK